MTSLLARAPAADRQFERIYRKHLADVYRYTLAVLRNPQDAEDVTQTTFLNAYRAMQNGERPEMPKNWLIAIAHNACRQRFRQAQRRPQELPLFEDGAEAGVEEHEEEYSADDIQRALGYLAFNQRAALVMRELEGRSYAEISAIMGLSVSAVETLIFRARRALREQLEGSLSCQEAEFLLSKQADGALARAERGQLRAHLRECEECAAVARRQRASRGALKAMLTGIPVPASLGSLFGGGSTAGVAIATKAVAVVCAGALVGGAGYEGAKKAHVIATHSKPAAAKSPRAEPGSSPLAEPGSSKTNQVRESPPGLTRKPSLPSAARPFVVPPGATHLKVESHVTLTTGFAVPKGTTHLRVTTHVHILRPKKHTPTRGQSATHAKHLTTTP